MIENVQGSIFAIAPDSSSGVANGCALMKMEWNMPQCECCGNEYDKAFDVVVGGESHTFDSFECAINMLAPKCSHCGCRIIGHGVEKAGSMFCCAHCAEEQGHGGLKDRA
jgi:hypothetical protein